MAFDLRRLTGPFVGAGLLKRMSFQHGYAECPLVPNAGQQSFDLSLLIRIDRKNWQPRATAVIAVKVAPVFHAADSEVPSDPATRLGNTALLLCCELQVVIVPRSEEHTSELQSLRHLVC